jgi:hypothetical protein
VTRLLGLGLDRGPPPAAGRTAGNTGRGRSGSHGAGCGHHVRRIEGVDRQTRRPSRRPGAAGNGVGEGARRIGKGEAVMMAALIEPADVKLSIVITY